MYPGLATFNQIINDSFMPWLSTFEDNKKLRRLIISTNDPSSGSGGFFKLLSDNIKYSGIKIKDVLFDDWNKLMILNDDYCYDPLFLKLKQIVWKDINVLFYLNLVLNCGFAHLYWLKSNTININDNRLVQHKVMRCLKDIGQLIIDCDNTVENNAISTNIIDAISMTLSFLWLKILSIYHESIQQQGLPLLKEEVIFNITYQADRTKNMNTLRVVLLDSLNLPEEKEIKEGASIKNVDVDKITEMDTSNISELSKEIKTDFEWIKNKIKERDKDKTETTRFIKPKEVLEILRISKTTLYKWRKKGKIKNCHLFGNRYEYDETEIIKLKTQIDEKGKNLNKL